MSYALINRDALLQQIVEGLLAMNKQDTTEGGPLYRGIEVAFLRDNIELASGSLTWALTCIAHDITWTPERVSFVDVDHATVIRTL